MISPVLVVVDPHRAGPVPQGFGGGGAEVGVQGQLHVVAPAADVIGAVEQLVAGELLQKTFCTPVAILPPRSPHRVKGGLSDIPVGRKAADAVGRLGQDGPLPVGDGAGLDQAAVLINMPVCGIGRPVVPPGHKADEEDGRTQGKGQDKDHHHKGPAADLLHRESTSGWEIQVIPKARPAFWPPP